MANYGGRGYARRNELAREKGFASYAEYRKATKAEREAASRELAARSPEYAATNAVEQVVSPPAKRRLHDLGGGRQLLRSMSNRELFAFLRRARDAGDMRVFGTLNVETTTDDDGDTEVTHSVVELWKRGGIDPAYIIDELEAADSRDVIAWLYQYVSDAAGNKGGISGGPASWSHSAITMVTLSSGAASEGLAA